MRTRREHRQGSRPSTEDASVEPRSDSIVFKDVGITYTTKRGELNAVESISGTVPPGSFVSIVGPSGCGKSSILEAAAGLREYTSGVIEVSGRPVQGPARDIAVVFQSDALLPWRSILSNTTLGLEARGENKKASEEQARDMLKLVGLAGFERAYPQELSGGMRQRASIARALALSPKFLLMDEPFGALDQQTRMLMGDELLRIWTETGCSVIMVTHDIQEAVLLSEEVWVLTKRPATMKSRLEVDLPRPRTARVVSSPQFHEHVSTLWSVLADEVSIEDE